MSSPWPAHVVGPTPRSGERSVWAWLVFGVGLVAGMLVVGLTLALWLVVDLACSLLTTVLTADDCGDAWVDAWLWTLAVLALAAIVLPIVGIVLAETDRRVLPYVLMLVPAFLWFVVFAIAA